MATEREPFVPPQMEIKPMALAVVGHFQYSGSGERIEYQAVAGDGIRGVVFWWCPPGREDQGREFLIAPWARIPWLFQLRRGNPDLWISHRAIGTVNSNDLAYRTMLKTAWPDMELDPDV